MNTQYFAHPLTINQTKLFFHVERQNAYHQAGHAAAIYLGNYQKQLPAVHFQLSINTYKREVRYSGRAKHFPSKYRAQVEGGRLLQSLPMSFTDAMRQLAPSEQSLCCLAIDADIFNLLAGPLAEAKYVALRDGEVFNANLVYLGALQFYGGSEKLDIINEFLGSYLPDPTERKLKLAEMFLAAYSFINEPSNWNSISVLAEFILEVSKDELKTVIPYEDLTPLLKH